MFYEYSLFSSKLYLLCASSTVGLPISIKVSSLFITNPFRESCHPAQLMSPFKAKGLLNWMAWSLVGSSVASSMPRVESPPLLFYSAAWLSSAFSCILQQSKDIDLALTQNYPYYVIVLFCFSCISSHPVLCPVLLGFGSQTV